MNNKEKVILFLATCFGCFVIGFAFGNDYNKNKSNKNIIKVKSTQFKRGKLIDTILIFKK